LPYYHYEGGFYVLITSQFLEEGGCIYFCELHSLGPRVRPQSSYSYFHYHFLLFTLVFLSFCLSGGSLVATAWRFLRLRMEEKASGYGG